jgi:hypothetical protein
VFLCAALLCPRAIAAPTAAPTAAQVAEGKSAFAAGVNLMRDPDAPRYEEALLQFQKAYALLGTWKVLGNLGICQLNLERDGEAIESFERYLAGGGASIDAEERAQVERDLATLRAQVVRVKVRLPVAAGRVVDERVNARGAKVRNEYAVEHGAATLGLHPGHHTIAAHVAGQPEMTWETDLTPGGTAEHLFAPPASAGAPAPIATPVVAPAREAPPAGPTSRPLPGSVLVVGGATLAVGVGAAVTGLMALSDRAKYQSANGTPGHDADELQSLHDTAASKATVSTILGAAALVGAGATAYLWLTRPTVASPARGGPVVVPWVGAGVGGVAIGGAL